MKRARATCLLATALLTYGGACDGPKGADAFSGAPLRTASSDAGVTVEILAEGTGAAAAPGDWVRVHYRVLLARDGTQVDSSHEREPLVFELDRDTKLIRGFHEAVRGMKHGELRRARVPQWLGYGARAIGPIPARSDLVFELELMEPPK